MAEQLPVLVWLPGQQEPEVVAAIDALPGARVARRCADLAELLGAAQAGVGVLAVLSLERGVDRARLAELARTGARSVLVAAPQDLHRAGALGADVVVPDGAAVAREVARALERLSEPGTTASPRSAGERTEVSATDGEGVAGETPAARAAAQRAPGTVIAVWGGPGAPGRSTIAAGLAALLAESGASVLLVDADTAAPSLAQALGLLDESAGIAALARSAGQGNLDGEALRRRAVELPGGLGFVSGLTRADRWRELPGEHVETVLEALRAHADWVVVDLAASLEAAPTRGADRNAVARTVLADAELVLVVAAPDPVGIRRTVAALVELEDSLGLEVRPGQERRLVVNATRPTSTPALRAAAEALQRFAGLAPDWTVPYDDAVGACLLAGRSLATAPRRSAARRAVQELAGDLLGVRPRRARTGTSARSVR